MTYQPIFAVWHLRQVDVIRREEFPAKFLLPLRDIDQGITSGMQATALGYQSCYSWRFLVSPKSLRSSAEEIGFAVVLSRNDEAHSKAAVSVRFGLCLPNVPMFTCGLLVWFVFASSLVSSGFM